MKLSATDADTKLGGEWFAGYTSEVEFHDAPHQLADFDAEARAEAAGDTEMVLFGAGLTVDGTLDLSSDVNSIFGVVGDLRAKRIILGDAILVVTGAVHADEWIIGRDTQGVFSVGGAQVEGDRDALLARVHAPVVAIYARDTAQFAVTVDGTPAGLDALIPGFEDLRRDSRAIKQLDTENRSPRR